MGEVTPLTADAMLAKVAYLASEKKRAALARSAALDAADHEPPALSKRVSGLSTLLRFVSTMQPFMIISSMM